MLCSLLKLNDVSKEHVVSIFRVAANASTLKMESTHICCVGRHSTDYVALYPTR
jgi:hypothetical protein